jgi:DNA polymerase I-like protein with 3'-5' exonuclease and polymerase domains
MKSRHKIVKTIEEVKQVIEYCKETGNASIDFETKATGPDGPQIGGDDKKPTGPAYKEDEPTVLSIVFQPGSGYAIPLFHKESPFSRTEALSIIKLIGREVLENPAIVKWAWNLKFEYKWFLRYGITPMGRLIDVMGLKYMLDEERPNGLKEFCENNIPEYAGYDTEVVELRKKYKGWEHIPLKPLCKYCVIDSDITLKIGLGLERMVMKEGFYKLFRNMFMMQTRVLAESEHMGMPVDREYLKEIIKTQKKRIEVNERNLLAHPKIKKFQRWRIRQKVKKLIQQTQAEIQGLKREAKKTGKDVSRMIKNREDKISRYIAGQLTTKKERVDQFNPNSPNQLVDLLFNAPGGFQFKVVAYTLDKRKQPTDRPSTNEKVLLHLKRKDKSGFIDRLLSQREMVKLYSTYMVAPLYRLTPESTLHSAFLIIGTVTGRLSSRNINMQNIPRDTTSAMIKKMFICPKGHLLLEVDYGQAELRVVAELARDEAMIDIFKRNYNIHVATACKINHCYDKYNEVKGILENTKHPDNLFWEKQKKRGKVLNFSILYLQSDKMTAEQMSSEDEIVTEEDAAEFKKDWFRAFPGIKRWMEKQEKFLKENGYVRNMFGRFRRLPDIWSEDKGKRNKSIRDCINAPIQGASSDFTQFATVVIREQIRSGELVLSDDPRWQSQAYTVHDSIGFYVQPKYLHKAVAAITKICSDPETLKYFDFEMKHVKMKVSPEIGTDWGSLKAYNAWENYGKLLQAA